MSYWARNERENVCGPLDSKLHLLVELECKANRIIAQGSLSNQLRGNVLEGRASVTCAAAWPLHPSSALVGEWRQETKCLGRWGLCMLWGMRNSRAMTRNVLVMVNVVRIEYQLRCCFPGLSRPLWRLHVRQIPHVEKECFGHLDNWRCGDEVKLADRCPVCIVYASQDQAQLPSPHRPCGDESRLTVAERHICAVCTDLWC